jgi:CRISPR-associated endonuclease Csn1
MSEQPCAEFVLGIDLGTNSVGWAIVGLIDGEPAKLVRAGVRVFDAGMEGDIESGQEQSRNLKRREARLHRRQLWRRARRMAKTFNLLRQFGLLPDGDASTPEKRQDLINALDKSIRESTWFQAKAASGAYPEPEQTLPYILRAAALDEPLEPHFLGRALYHLAQRRGFLSNRLKPVKIDEEEGKVKGTIKTLREEMKQQDSATLGDFLSHLSPAERPIRGPGSWTARDMYEKEFDAVCDVQAPFHPDALSGDHRAKLREAVFHQRPLKFDPNAIGDCELEAGEKRAPAYLLVSQRFRMLQTVNNLRLLPPAERERPLTEPERQKLVEALELNHELTFTQIRKLLGFPRSCLFKGEPEGEKRVIGNRTNAALYAILGEPWRTMAVSERDRMVECLRTFRKPEELILLVKQEWCFDDEAVEKLSEVTLEPDYMNLSRKAMERLLPRLERGESFAAAREAEYHTESRKVFEALPLLPPLAAEEVQRRVGTVRNPAVTRSLSELRRVVNGVIRQFGKPAYIHVELARDLKKSRKQRRAISKRNHENEAGRKRASERVQEMTGDPYPSRDDIRRIQLFDDCHGQCLYCGESIPGRNFLGKESQVDIDHIIPFSRSLDNSYMNLVICHSRCNRAKGDRTPFEAYSADREAYEHILSRVKGLAGDRRTMAEKLRRFAMDAEELQLFLDGFRNRQLNDTAYAASIAKGFLGLLYGGEIDEQKQRRVFARSGGATSDFRALWKLNSILKDGPTTGGGRIEKERTDHRHHAVDAVVIGLSSDRMIERLSRAAQVAAERESRRKLFGPLDEPWPSFLQTVSQEIDRIVVSHRVSKKVSGPLHEESLYSKFEAKAPTGSPLSVPRLRKWINELSAKDVENIADEGVKSRIREKVAGVGGDPRKLPDPKDPANQDKLPYMIAKKGGRHIPIKRVRVKVSLQPVPIAMGPRQRYVKLGSNHHIEVFAGTDRRAREQWKGEVVSMFHAYQRLAQRRPVVNPEKKGGLVFSLAPGECVRFDDGPFKGQLFVMRGVTQERDGRIILVPTNDARERDKIRESKLYRREFVNTLREWKTRKVVVTPLGEVSEAHD